MLSPGAQGELALDLSMIAELFLLSELCKVEGISQAAVTLRLEVGRSVSFYIEHEVTGVDITLSHF